MSATTWQENSTHVVVAVTGARGDHLLEPRETLTARCRRGNRGERFLDGQRVDVGDVPTLLLETVLPEDGG